MNTKTRIASALAASMFALLAAGTANAQVYGDTGGYNVPELQAKSTKTRAQVQAELAQARANGELSTHAEGYDFAARQATASTKTREEVRAEAARALKSGEASAFGNYTRG